MKAGIVTITNGYNYGNRLQNYAVQEALESVGISAETIWKTTNVFDTENPVYLRKLYIKRFLHYHLTKEENRILNFYRFNKTYIHRSSQMINEKSTIILLQAVIRSGILIWSIVQKQIF